MVAWVGPETATLGFCARQSPDKQAGTVWESRLLQHHLASDSSAWGGCNDEKRCSSSVVELVCVHHQQGPTGSATLSDHDNSTVRLPDWADLVAHDCRGVLIVEGPSDSKYLRIAAETSNRLDLLDRLSVVAAGEGIDGPPTGGAALVVRHAILFAATNSTPVAVLLDNDGIGLRAQDILIAIGEKTGEWRRNANVIGYHQAVDGPRSAPWEAEDVWPDHLIDRFLDDDANRAFEAGLTELPFPAQRPRRDLTGRGKGQFARFLQTKASADDCVRWIRLLERVNEQFPER